MCKKKGSALALERFRVSREQSLASTNSLCNCFTIQTRAMMCGAILVLHGAILDAISVLSNLDQSPPSNPANPKKHEK
jgi:hypothetical protein